MRLLLKLLRPEKVPSPNRKSVPFGTRMQLLLYRRCLKRLKRWYYRYAYSDSMIIVGNPSIKVYHEFRDIAFETELRRMHVTFSEGMIECSGATSHYPDKRKRHRYFKCFHLEDTFLLDIDNQKISIKHGNGRSFISTINGHLKESNDTSVFAKYVFSGSRHIEKDKRAKINTSISFPYSGINSSDDSKQRETKISTPRGGQDIKKKSTPLFGDDPLLRGIIPGNAPMLEPVKETPTTKTLEGVIIDESF